MAWASVLASEGGREGGQQVQHKHTCPSHPFYLPSWGCCAEGPISCPSELCNQHCQAQLPVEHTGLTLQTVRGDVGKAGRPAGRSAGRLAGWPAGWLAGWLAAVLEGSMDHVKPR